MKNLKNYFIAGMIGLGSLGIFGHESYGREKQDTFDQHIDGLLKIFLEPIGEKKGKSIYNGTCVENKHIAYYVL